MDWRGLLSNDPNYDSEACIEIWEHEIHVRTAWSNYTYRVFKRGDSCWCEYIGAYRGLLEQTLLPTLTPKMNILDSVVIESSLTGNKKKRCEPTVRKTSN